MKLSIPLLSLFIIFFSHNILGRTTETLEAIDSTRNSEHYVIPYNSICYHRRVEGYDVERNELSEAILAVQENIKDKMKTEGKPAKNFIETMCFQDWKIKSLSEKLVNKVCTSETDKSKVVQDLVNETCGLAYVDLVIPILPKNEHCETPSNPSMKKENY